jgi:hypothetical protein
VGIFIGDDMAIRVPQDEKSGVTTNQQPDILSSRHRAAMRMEIAGHTPQDIADELGFSIQRLSVIMNSPLYKEEKEKMARDVQREFTQAEGKKLAMDSTAKVLRDATLKAARTLEGALDRSDQPSVAISAAKDILDRGGYQKEEKVRANILVEPSQSLIDMLNRTASAGAGTPKPEPDIKDEGEGGGRDNPSATTEDKGSLDR